MTDDLKRSRGVRKLPVVPVITAAVIVLIALVSQGVSPAWALTGGDRGYAPAIPARREPLDLFVREVGGDRARPGSVRIVRYGRRGSPEQPDVLDLPRAGRAFVLHAYDLVAPVERTVEVRYLPGYGAWLELSPGSLAVAVAEDHFDLAYGSVRWIADTEAATDLRLTAGPWFIQGRGEGRVTRSADSGGQLELVVAGGRFEIYREDEPVAVVRAGESRNVSLQGDGVPVEDPAESLARAAAVLAELLQEMTVTLYGGAPPGDKLHQLREAARELAALYGHAEVNALPGVSHPDLMVRSLGEALRILNTFRP